MKLFIHDEKHGQVHGELVLGPLSWFEKDLLEQVFEFLDKNRITTRYHRLKLAYSYKIEYIDGEPSVCFSIKQ